MRTFTFLSILFTSSLTIAQIEGPPQVNENAQQKTDDILKCRDMPYRMTPDCNGTVYYDEDNEAVMHQKSGKPFTGSCKVCHMNGNLEMYLTYQNGRPFGQDTVWYENGKPNLVRSHDSQGMGKEDGTWKLYRHDEWEKNYVMGAEDGESRYYFPDSSLWKIETWSLGQMSGIKQEFYRNNTLKKEVMYQNGVWNGKYITYFETGMVESEQQYENGLKVGLSRYYYNNGELFYEESHEKGLREGEVRRFFPKDQRMWTVENYKKDLRHGMFEEYYDTEKNTIKYKATYKKGVLIEEHFFDEFGDEVAPPAKETTTEGDDNGSNEEGEKGKKKKKKDKE
jgi:antitoxin component YwqK of YwqJK toxin-antitoxin module